MSYPKPTSGVPFTGSSSKGNPRVVSSSPGGKNRPTSAPGKGKGNYLERHGFAPYSQLKGVNFPMTNKPIVIELDGQDDIMEEEDLSRVAPGDRSPFFHFTWSPMLGLAFDLPLNRSNLPRVWLVVGLLLLVMVPTHI